MEKRKRNIIILSWCLVALWACLIFFMSSRTENEFDAGDGIFAQIKMWLTQIAVQNLGLDAGIVPTAAHFTEFAIFGVLLFVALWHTLNKREDDKRIVFWLPIIVAVMLASVYGVTDEFHQIFVDGRTCDPADWLTDTIGAAFGALAAGLICSRLTQRR